MFIGGDEMKKLFWGILFLAFVIEVPVPTMAGVDVNVNIGLPPPIVFSAPPDLVVLPETNVYVVPDVAADIFFYHGWWWRPWEGRWYRSRYYDSGWAYYHRVPSFYAMIPSGWRNDYRDHRWKGHQWNYQRMPQQQVQRNWSGWEKSGHWEKQQTWGVQGLQPRTQSQKPSGEMQRQPRQQGRAVKPERAQQHQEARPQSREVQSQHSQQQRGNSEKGKEERQETR
jgi:hypothetical protein